MDIYTKRSMTRIAQYRNIEVIAKDSEDHEHYLLLTTYYCSLLVLYVLPLLHRAPKIGQNRAK